MFCIGNFFVICLSSDKPRDIAFIPSFHERLQTRRKSEKGPFFKLGGKTGSHPGNEIAVFSGSTKKLKN